MVTKEPEIYLLKEEDMAPSSILDFLRGAIPKVSFSDERCPHCEGPIRFPIVIHPEHYRAMVLLINKIMDYAAKKDILPEQVWTELSAEINRMITIH